MAREEKKKNNEKKEESFEKESEILRKQIEELESKIEKLENIAKASNEQVLLLQNELNLLRQQHKKELQEKEEKAVAQLIKDLLVVLDNFERALNHMKGEEACKQVVIGVEMIFKEMKRLLNKYGLEELNLQKFDPNYCEAVSTIEREDIEEGEKIIEVLQKGYKFRGKLLRPAKVIVAIKKAKEK